MNSTNGRAFVDTNVLIYAHDIDAGPKHEIAKSVLRELWSERSGVLSMQVLQEFYVNVTRKISVPLPKAAARGIVENYRSWCVEASVDDISTAFRIEDQARVGFWDALMLASASRSGAVRVISEDLNAGQTILGLRIENPFGQPR
jgi:predicted nucleic acid-binding protein